MTWLLLLPNSHTHRILQAINANWLAIIVTSCCHDDVAKVHLSCRQRGTERNGTRVDTTAGCLNLHMTDERQSMVLWKHQAPSPHENHRSDFLSEQMLLPLGIHPMDERIFDDGSTDDIVERLRSPNSFVLGISSRHRAN